jgi:hypothetical protein
MAATPTPSAFNSNFTISTFPPTDGSVPWTVPWTVFPVRHVGVEIRRDGHGQ